MTTMRSLMVAAVICGSAALGVAQPGSGYHVLLGEYEQGNYLRVVVLAESLMADSAALSGGDAMSIRTYWAFSLVALGRDDEAVAQFKKLLQQRPATDLNPEFVSPKIITVFKRAQAEINQSLAVAAQAKPVLLNAAAKPSKPGALVRTLLWPGWGQSYRGQAKRGRLFRIASLTAAAGLGATELGTYLSHRDYLDARDADRISSSYTAYNHWYRFRNLSVNLAVSVWVLGVIDIMMSD